MANLEQTIASDLIARYKKLAGWLHEMAAPLSEEQFWVKPFPFGNSFGHLVLHLTGNLNYYIRSADCGDGLCAGPPAGVYECDAAIQSGSVAEIRSSG